MTGKPTLTPEIHLLRRNYYNPAFFAEAQPEVQSQRPHLATQPPVPWESEAPPVLPELLPGKDGPP